MWIDVAGVHEGEGGLVGGGFIDAAVGEKAAIGDALGSGDDGGCGFTVAGEDSGADADDGAEDGLIRSAGGGAAQADEVAAGDVTKFVGEDADEFFGGFCFLD